jgi:hypothetical protein
MEKRLSYTYDEESDELNIVLGELGDAIGLEIDDEVYAQVDPETKEVRGFTILHFGERFKKAKGLEPFSLPLVGQFRLSKEVGIPHS